MVSDMDKDGKKSAFDNDFDPEASEENLNNMEKAQSEEDKVKRDVNDMTQSGLTETVDHNDDIDEAKLKHSTQDDEFDVSHILMKQINEEYSQDQSALDENSEIKNVDEETSTQSEKKKKRVPKTKFGIWFASLPRFARISSITGFSIVLLLCIGFIFYQTGLAMKFIGAVGGQVWKNTTNEFETNVTPGADIVHEDELSDDDTLQEVTNIEWNNIDDGMARHEDYCINILLLGEEAIGNYASRGRTDMIVIATMNTEEKTLKMTSLMRDTLVQIPGYKDNKLNSVYEKGGIELLYDTIELNYDIHIDGCALVGFDSFEEIIDILGGIEITLTESEARYLRNTNYISNPANRTVVAGTQTLNGNQALGYSRVRYRATASGQNNDYGRTERHRTVLNAIFNKCKNQSKVELLSLMTKILPYVTTDITSSQFEQLLNIFFEIGFNGDIEQLRIPANGTFTDNVKVRGMDVLIPDIAANTEILHTFIFGDYIPKTTTQSGSNSTQIEYAGNNTAGSVSGSAIRTN